MVARVPDCVGPFRYSLFTIGKGLIRRSHVDIRCAAGRSINPGPVAEAVVAVICTCPAFAAGCTWEKLRFDPWDRQVAEKEFRADHKSLSTFRTFEWLFGSSAAVCPGREGLAHLYDTMAGLQDTTVHATLAAFYQGRRLQRCVAAKISCQCFFPFTSVYY